jgi:hypothetical protein
MQGNDRRRGAGDRRRERSPTGECIVVDPQFKVEDAVETERVGARQIDTAGPVDKKEMVATSAIDAIEIPHVENTDIPNRSYLLVAQVTPPETGLCSSSVPKSPILPDIVRKNGFGSDSNASVSLTHPRISPVSHYWSPVSMKPAPGSNQLQQRASLGPKHQPFITFVDDVKIVSPLGPAELDALWKSFSTDVRVLRGSRGSNGIFYHVDALMLQSSAGFYRWYTTGATDQPAVLKFELLGAPWQSKPTFLAAGNEPLFQQLKQVIWNSWLDSYSTGRSAPFDICIELVPAGVWTPSGNTIRAAS